jgi:hypothetical protein
MDIAVKTRARLPDQHHSQAGFGQEQRDLLSFNRYRLSPDGKPSDWRQALAWEHRMLLREGEFIEAERQLVLDLLRNVPTEPEPFLAWFSALRETGPGQGDPLFPWLANHASAHQMRWFLSQEVAGEAGFDDLVALAQVKLPPRPKLEMARNYWDEMGRGNEKGMHGPMLARVAAYFEIKPEETEVVPEALALGNLMAGLAANRRYAYEAIGALGAIELTAPTRAVHVVEGLRRLKVPARARQYFAVHSILDVEHSHAWNKEVLGPLVQEDGRRALPIAAGAIMRLNAGRRCFDRYHEYLEI